MDSISRLGLSTLVTGTIASVVSTVALAALARAEGKSEVQPTNATSHWLHGDEAGQREGADLAHTAVGYATHHASAIFWAVPFEAWLAYDPPHTVGEVVGRAALVSGFAAAFDYGVVPNRLTPGWELVVSDKSMVGAFASLACGLAAGALVSRALPLSRNG
jgi:hypothetical protein